MGRRSILPETLVFVLRGAFVREFFVVVRVWCFPCRVSRVACIGGARVAAAVGWVGPAWSSGITCRFL